MQVENTGEGSDGKTVVMESLIGWKELERHCQQRRANEGEEVKVWREH